MNPPATPTSTPTNIYVIEAEFGAYKIGIARDVSKRLSQLRVGLPFALESIGSAQIPEAHALAVETSLHKRYGEWRMRGEWFALPPKFETAKAFAEDVCGCAELLAKAHAMRRAAQN